MPRSAASIQAEIDRLETDVAGASAVLQSAGSDSSSASKIPYADKIKRLDWLYVQLGRVNGTAPMIVRGVVRGMNVR